MIIIPDAIAHDTHRPPGIPGRIQCVQVANGVVYTAKPIKWNGSDDYAIRLAVEYIYYAIAHWNCVSMPEARILHFKDKLWWGMAVLPGRVALSDVSGTLNAYLNDRIKLSLQEYPEERDGLIRAAFLDTLLLNQDRTETNILAQEDRGRLRLSYLDHEQSLGWRNNLIVPNDNVIQDPAFEYGRIAGKYGAVFRNRKWALESSTLADRTDIFQSLEYWPAMLEEIRPNIPPGWIGDDKFLEISTGLANWWTFIKKQAYEDLDAAIFGRA